MNKKINYLAVALLIAVSLLAFGRIIGNDFINLDDNVYITENNQTRSGLTINTFVWSFGAVVCGNWHPLTVLSHALDWSLFGANAAGHHLVSLLLHIGAVLFLFLFLKKTTKNLWLATFVAALFALHPLRVESVAWAAERKDVLSMFFGMATLYAYGSYAERATVSRYLVCIFLFALSLLSKPMLVTVPFILVLIDYWPLRRWHHKSPFRHRGLFYEKIPFFMLTIVSSFLTIWAQDKGGTIATLDRLPFVERLLNAVISYGAYVYTIFWPVDLAVFYPYQSSLALWQVFVAGLLLIGITTAVVLLRKKAPFLFVGWFWYVGTLVPVIGLIQVGRQAMADRYTYLPSIGIALMIGGSLCSVVNDKRRTIVLILSLTIIGMVMTLLTWRQCGYWKDSRTLFSHALEATKDNYLAHHNLGVALAHEGNNDQAIPHYLAALAINPSYDSAHDNLGAALTAIGRYDDAIPHYLAAIKINPSNDSAHSNLGVALARVGKEDEAVARYLQAIDINPANADAQYNLANLLIKQGKTEQAENHFREAIQADPGYYDAYYSLADLSFRKGMIDRAIEQLRHAVRIQPSTKALNNLGVYLEKQLKHDEAIHYYRQALQIEPQNPGLHFNIGVALGNKGELNEAVQHFQQAVDLNPDFEQARRMLQMARELLQQKHP